MFRGDLPDGQRNAVLNSPMGRGRYAYSEGYRRGARILVQYVIDHGMDQDFLVYPIIFLYRHHVELVLKDILLRAPSFTGRPLTETARKHLDLHRLDLLWADVEPVLADIWDEMGWDAPDADEMAGIGEYIRQLAAVDPDSYRFRYTHSKKGDPSLPTSLTHINLRHFGEMMERFAEYFDSLDTAIYEFENARDEMRAEVAEMEAEWRHEMQQYLDYSRQWPSSLSLPPAHAFAVACRRRVLVDVAVPPRSWADLGAPLAIASWLTRTPRSASESWLSWKLRWNLQYSQTAWAITSAGKRWPR